MLINLSEVFAFSNNKVTIDAYNLYPYTINAVDIYFTCSNAELYNFVLKPILPEYAQSPTTGLYDGFSYYNTTYGQVEIYNQSINNWVIGNTLNNNAKISLTIDGNTYPIKAGLQGESPTNPIIFQKSQEFSNVHLSTRTGSVLEVVGGPDVETWTEEWNSGESRKDSNNITSDIVVGNNVIANDEIHIEFKIADGFLTASKKFGFGGSGQFAVGSPVVTGNMDGFGGSKQVSPGVFEAIEAFGGIVPDAILEEAIFVIQRSDYLQVQEINSIAGTYGFGSGGYGGTTSPASGYGGIILEDMISEVDCGVRY